MSLETKMVRLEKKVNLLTKAMEIMLLESEVLSPKELKEVKSRLRDFLAGKKNKFVSLEDALHGL